MTHASIKPLVSADWLANEIGADDLRIFDATVLMTRRDDGGVDVVSGAEAWAEGHVPDSGHLDLVGELSDPNASLWFTAPSPDRLAEALGKRGVGDDTRVVVYDDAVNMWATRAWWLMRAIGFDNAAVLDGGLTAWQAAGHAISTDPAPRPASATLTPHPRPACFIDSSGVLAAIESESSCIINSLSEDNHSGADNSYGRPGHIPGAANIPAMRLVDSQTRCYRPLEELKAEFEAIGASTRPTITYCGGGIAATSDAFVLHLLGQDDVAVYDGSLRDWNEQGLPLES